MLCIVSFVDDVMFSHNDPVASRVFLSGD